MEVKKDRGQAHEAGKAGEERHDDAPPLAPVPELSNKRVRNPGAKTRAQTKKCRKARHACSRVHHEDRPDEGNDHGQDLHLVRDLPEDKDRGDDCKERGHLVEDVRVGKPDVIDRIEVEDQPRSPEDCPCKEVGERSLLNPELLLRSRKQNQRDDRRDEVSKERLLERRHIAGKADKERHQGEKERVRDHEEDAKHVGIHRTLLCHHRSLPFVAMISRYQ